MLARFLGVSHHDLANLVGNLWAAATDQLVVNPSDNDDVAVPAVAKSRMKLVVNVDQPTLADHRLGARHCVIERGVKGAHRDTSAVKSGQPAASRLRFETFAQLS